jgi:uncharacterized protein
MAIQVQKLAPDELKRRGIFSWPIWTKEISRFDWSYTDPEECYLLEGQVEVVADNGEKVAFGKGDFVTFPKGMSCTWNVKSPVKKHYNFP